MSERCNYCGEFYDTAWKVSNELWETVTGTDDGSGLCCIPCFDEMATEYGVFLYWGASESVYPVEAGRMTEGEMATEIAEYEKHFGMSSEEFLELRARGEAPDTFEAMDWAILLKHLGFIAPSHSPVP